MSDGKVPVSTLVHTLGGTGVPLGREDHVGDESAVPQLSSLGFSSGSLISVERGLFRKRQPLSVTVIAEEGPFWLAAMRVTDWSSIQMLAWKPSDELDHPVLALAMGKLREHIEEVKDLDTLVLNSCISSLVW